MPLPKEPRKPRGGTLGGAPKKSTDISKRQVKRVKRQLGSAAREIAGSGNQPDKKGDIDLQQFLDGMKLELKTTTDKKSIRVTIEMLVKIVEEAMATGRGPGMVISFETPGLPPYFPRDWALFPLRKVSGAS